MRSNLEKRVTALEQKVGELEQQLAQRETCGRRWIDDLYGRFANDPVFAKAMKLGRTYRRSLRPRSRS